MSCVSSIHVLYVCKQLCSHTHTFPSLYFFTQNNSIVYTLVCTLLFFNHLTVYFRDHSTFVTEISFIMDSKYTWNNPHSDYFSFLKTWLLIFICVFPLLVYDFYHIMVQSHSLNRLPDKNILISLSAFAWRISEQFYVIRALPVHWCHSSVNLNHILNEVP